MLMLGLPVPAAAATARHEAITPGCTGTADLEQIARAQQKLGDERSQLAGLRLLRRQGDEGCSAIVEWVQGGAPGASEEAIRTAANILARSDVAGGLEQALLVAQHASESVGLEILTIVQERLPVLTAEEAASLVNSDHPDIREHMVSILIGIHVNVDVELDGYGVEISDKDFWGADFPPAHDPQLTLLANDDSAEVREHVAATIGRAWKGELKTPRSFTEHIKLLLQDSKDDVRNQAAESLGLGCPPDGMELIGLVIDLDQSDLVDAVIDGLEDRIEDAEPNMKCADMAQKLAEEGPFFHRGDAKKLARSARRQAN